jgi:hypothetical protein
MKMNQGSYKKAVVIGSFAVAVIASGLVIAARPAPHYVAHEWGTFTSVQGGDGVLLDWRPLETSELPKFVYDWTHPGIGRQGAVLLGKGAMIARQRMETPVIYFYSEQEQAIDVSVEFPQGLITEWYPQASLISPSRSPGIKQSRASWAHLQLLPEQQNKSIVGRLPFDGSGSHYFAARETDSDYVRMAGSGATNPSPEQEKFIFYRGVGNFGTPLQVTMASDNEAVLVNTGKEAIENLFVLQLRDRAGKFIYVERLAAGERRSVAINSSAGAMPLETMSLQLGDRMAQALVQAGLYQREAKAMVRTWTDSWFQENGVRVLYLLPRSWTDSILPLRLDPSPRELVRVMVGRTEVIPAAVQQNLANALTKASKGDLQARDAAVAEFRKLGRFGEPALRLATKDAKAEVNQLAWTLLQAAATKPANVTKVF